FVGLSPESRSCSGAGNTTVGTSSGVVVEGGGETGLAELGAAAGALALAADLPAGARQPGIVSSCPGRIFAGSAIAFTAAMSPSFTPYLRAIPPSVSPGLTACFTGSADGF